jgi:membrane protein DedA with SNARE-associated domain
MVLLTFAFAVLVIALPEGYLPGPLGTAPDLFGGWLKQFGSFAAGGLLTIEESGIPLPVPGDVFVMYTGHLLAHRYVLLVLAWLGLTGCALIGASLLYLVSQRWGRRLVEGEFGRIVHLNPGRVAIAENWCRRWGFWALVVGRHLPGCRIPVTVASGIFRIRYRVFAVAVGISTATWAGFFLAIGVTVGDRLQDLSSAHHNTYALVVISIVSAMLAYVLVRLFMPDIRAALRNGQAHPES